MTTKEAMMKALAELPEEAGYEDAIERFQYLQSIEKGIAQVKAGETLSNEEVMKRIEKWLK